MLGQRDDRIFNVFGAIDLAGAGFHERHQRFAADILQRAVDADIAEGITLALIDSNGDGIFVGALVELAKGRNDLEIRIAAIVVVAAQQLLVGAQAVFVIDVVAGQERQEGRALGRDHVGEPPVAESVVADEIEGPDLGAAALGDVEHHIDAIFAEIDDLRADIGVVAADAAISGADRLDVSLKRVGRIRAARLRLHDGGQGSVLELLVALEQHLVDDLVLGDLNDQRAARLVDADIGKQPGGEEPLHRFVDVGSRIGLARLDRQIVPNGFGIDALVTPDLDRGRHGRLDGGDGGKLQQNRARHDNRRGQSDRRHGA